MHSAFAPGAALLALAAFPVWGQTALSLTEFNARAGAPDFAPKHVGEQVSIRGVASARALHFPEYTLLAIQDAEGGGVLQVSHGDQGLDSARPGDEVLASGVVRNLGGARY